MRVYFETLNEKDRRRYAAVEAEKLPHGGIAYTAHVLGCVPRTVRRGLKELREMAELIRLPIQVAHCSKYNPIERRAFCHVEEEFAGCVFGSEEMIAERARAASTESGLTTTAAVMDETFTPSNA